MTIQTGSGSVHRSLDRLTPAATCSVILIQHHTGRMHNRTNHRRLQPLQARSLGKQERILRRHHTQESVFLQPSVPYSELDGWLFSPWSSYVTSANVTSDRRSSKVCSRSKVLLLQILSQGKYYLISENLSRKDHLMEALLKKSMFF